MPWSPLPFEQAVTEPVTPLTRTAPDSTYLRSLWTAFKSFKRRLTNEDLSTWRNVTVAAFSGSGKKRRTPLAKPASDNLPGQPDKQRLRLLHEPSRKSCLQNVSQRCRAACLVCPRPTRRQILKPSGDGLLWTVLSTVRPGSELYAPPQLLQFGVAATNLQRH